MIRAPMDKSFLVLFFKKELLAFGATERKAFFLKKEAKTFYPFGAVDPCHC